MPTDLSNLASDPSGFLPAIPSPPDLQERLRSLRRTIRANWEALRFATVRRAKYARQWADWNQRIEQVLACPDLQSFTPHAQGGLRAGGAITMHNGLRVVPGCYYGARGDAMFVRTKGVHEPQEERAFAAVLPHIPPNSTMLELGAYWGFYSMWFAQQVRGARCVLVEPDQDNLDFGKANFRLNNLPGHWIKAGIADAPGNVPGLGEVTSVDAVVRAAGLTRINLLHSDIQGFEMAMLDGARTSLAAGIIDFAFISTHSNDLHRQCRRRLIEAEFEILADADMDQSYSFDGVLVAKRKGVAGPDRLEISLRPFAAKPGV